MAYVQEFFCDKATCSKNITMQSQQSGDSTSKDMSSQSVNQMDTGMAEEIVRLRSEVERLLCENRELREELARLKESDEAQAFYAGGSERSGQQILGPGKGRKDIVTEMFKSVRERGAVVFDDEPSSTSRGRSGVFSGVGYRLGQTADDHEQVTPSNTQSQENSRLVRLCLYREGFSVDGGALRLYSDPENAEFLSCVRRSEIPPELAGLGGEVRVSLQDRRHEECPKHMVKPPAFTGKGHLLGSPTPPTVGATAPVASDASDRAANQRTAQDAVGLDPDQPTTTVQFRLADGSRLTGRFNHSHTVADLSAYVSRAEPAYQLRPFALVTTFPSAELADPAATLAAANLLNSTVLQRLK
ncbi:hypothetical protein O3G_MSEX014971 [Manduca sexta]|nr:hypothetical protein O3G_MSEX014971 [Manduca sexta]